MFMVPGSDNVVRVNGSARVIADPELTGQFEQNGKHPRSVVVVTIGEIYFQCSIDPPPVGRVAATGLRR